MKTVSGETRKIGLSFYRMIMGLGKGVSTIKGSPYQNTFLSVFDNFNVKNFNTSEINYYPFISVNEDLINLKGKTVEKLGLIGKEKAIACEVIVSITKYD